MPSVKESLNLPSETEAKKFRSEILNEGTPIYVLQYCMPRPANSYEANLGETKHWTKVILNCILQKEENYNNIQKETQEVFATYIDLSRTGICYLKID